MRSLAVRSLTSLCRREGKPPREQESKWSTVNVAPQAQCVGVLLGAQPYHRAKASKKAPLWRQKPCSLIGNEVNQLEAPGWLARSMALDRAGNRETEGTRGNGWNQREPEEMDGTRGNQRN